MAESPDRLSLCERIVESASEGVWVIDAANVTTFVNQSMAEMLGYTREEMVGVAIFDALDDDDGRRIARLSVERCRQGLSDAHECRFRRKDGTPLGIRLVAKPLLDAAGASVGAIIFATALAAERLRPAEDVWLWHILDSSLNEIYIFREEDLRFVYVNQGALRNLGYTLEQMRDMTPLDVKPALDRAAFLSQISPVVTGRKSEIAFQTIHRRRDGSDYPVEVHLQLVPDSHPRTFVAIVNDISERLEADRLLRASEARFRSLIEHSSDLIALLGIDGSLKYLSPAFETSLGHRVESWRDRRMFDLVWPDDLALAEEAFAKSLRSPGETVPWQLRLRHADGAPRWFEGTGTNYLEDAATDGIVVNCRDITDRKRTELALRESEERLRQAVRVSNIGIFDHDHATDRIYWSPRQRQIHGWMPDEPISLAQFILLVHPDDAGRVSAAVQRAHDPAGDGIWDIEHRIVRRDGSVRWLSARSQTFFAGEAGARRPVRTVGAVIDITDRKKVEEELLRLEAAIASSLNGLAMSDMAGHLTYVNRAFLDLWGYGEPSQVLGRPAVSFWGSRGEASEVVAAIQECGSWSGEMVARHADGALLTLQLNASQFNGADGQPAGMIASFLDITERKRTEEALRVKDQAIATALNGIAISDADGRIIYANAAFLRLWRYDSEGDVLGKTPLDLAEPTAAQRLLEELRTHGTWQGELVARRKDGSTFDVLLSANVVRDAGGNVVNLMGSFLDISEARRLQTQLLQAQKMEAVGRLAGGVAHDFNNLLTVIKGYLGLALLDLNAADPLHRDLSEVQRAADSAATLTQQLLAFSRKQVINPQVLSLNDIIQRLQPMLKRLIGEDVDLQTMAAADLGLVRFDPGQGEQILMNLAVNARDAMPDGGKLTIETANVRLDDEYVKTHGGVQPGNYAMLAVSDTGSGMSEEVRSHVFEPFFTTKESGSGTGLGLAMIYGAVSQNAGHIEVYSEVGHGSTFKIYLPLVSGQEAAPLRSVNPAAHARGTETILLVEDEEPVRALASRVLRRLGYEVRECGDAASAIRLVQGTAEIVHLLVTDVVMPNMNGRVLAERIRELKPDIKVLFTSGYTANVIVHRGVLKDGVEFLQKPYSVESLANRVREVLDKV